MVTIIKRFLLHIRWLLALCVLATVLYIRCGKAEAKTFASLSADTQYVGSASCQPCHKKIFEQYGETGMGRSMYSPDPDDKIEDYGAEAIVYDAFNDFYYEPFWQGGRMFVKEFRLNGKDTSFTRVEEVTFVVGSGHQTRSYLMQRNGYLFEMPITWYVIKGIWDMSPGYDNGNNSRFSREIGEECLACHTGNFELEKGSKNRFSEINLGIDCEQCHGPGSAHVKAIQNGQLIDVGVETDYTIVNPAKLPTNLQFDVCQQCHLQGVNAMGDQASVRDFRPGMKLSDAFHVFLEQPEDPDAFGIASHAERLQQSECFLQSDGKLTCTTCHNPHKSISVTEQNVYTQQCEQCHTQAMIPDCGESDSLLSLEEGNCISCHMPQRGTRDIPHVFFHDHKIRVVEEVEESNSKAINALADRLHCATGEANNDKEGRALMRYFEEHNAKREYLALVDSLLAPESRYYRARMAFAQGNLIQARALAQSELKANPNFTELQSLLGEILIAQGDFKEAVAVLDAAVEQAPEATEAAFLGAVALLKSRPGDKTVLFEARPRFTKLLEKRPFDARLHNNLGFIALNLGEFAQAQYHMEEALKLDPDYAPALETSSYLFLQLNQKEKARSYFDRLIQVEPDRPSARMLQQRLK